MSKKESSSNSGTASFRIKLNADGTSNLDAAMLQDIHDYMSRIYPQTGVGTKTGVWRDIEKERPKLNEDFIRALQISSTPSKQDPGSRGSGRTHSRFDEDGESLNDLLRSFPSSTSSSSSDLSDLDRLQFEMGVEVYKKKMIKFEVDTVPKYLDEVIQMFSVYHSFLDSDCKNKLDELEPERYRKIVEERNGEKLWSMVLKVLVAGSTHIEEEVNRRLAKINYQSLKMQPDVSIQKFKPSFDETYRRYAAAGNPAISEEEQARDYLWAVDPDRYKSARNMLLNRRNNTTGKRIPLPATVIDMHNALKDFIPDTASKKAEQATDPLAFVYQISASRTGGAVKPIDKGGDKRPDRGEKHKKKPKKSKDKDQGTKGGTSDKPNKQQDPKKPRDTDRPKSVSGKCNTCHEDGHFARDCPFKKQVEEVVAEAKAAKERKSTVAFTWAGDSHTEGPYGLMIFEDAPLFGEEHYDNDDVVPDLTPKDDQVQNISEVLEAAKDAVSSESSFIDGLSESAIELMCNSALMDKYKLSPSDMAIDSGSEISGCRHEDNVEGMQAVAELPTQLSINGVAGSANIKKKGYTPDFGKIFISAIFPMTLLSLSCIEDHGCHMKYETDKTAVDGAQCMHVTTPSGKTFYFKRQPGTSLYIWRARDAVSSYPVTVAEQKLKYTTRQIKQADDANGFMAALGWPHKDLAKLICRSGTLTDNPISTKDIDNAFDIYGKPLEFEKGARTKKHHHPYVPVQEVEKPTTERCTDLFVDLFYINKIIMLVAACYIPGCERPLVLTNHMNSKAKEQLFDGCMRIIGMVTKYQVRVGVLSIDRETAMGPVEPLLNRAGYKVDMLADHIEQAERSGRSIKEGVRKVQASVKFPLFGVLIVYVIYFVVSRLNLWPNPRRPEQLTPIENLTLTKRSFPREAFAPCLTYIRVDAKPGENDNSMDPRAMEGLYLFPAPNNRGGSMVLNLKTGRPVTRILKHSDIAPMPDYVIEQLRASADKNSTDLTFRTDRGIVLDDAAIADDATAALEVIEQRRDPEIRVEPIQSTQSIQHEVVQSEYRSGSDTVYRDADENSRCESEADTSTAPSGNIEASDIIDTVDSFTDTIVQQVAPTEIVEETIVQEHQQQQLSSRRRARSIQKEPIQQQGTRQSARLAAKPKTQWRSKEVGAIYSFHMTMMKALRKHGREGTKALVKELMQIDDLGTIRGAHLTPAAMKRAIMSLVFFKEKYLSTGQFDKLKARIVAGGHQQDRTVYDSKDISSPTVSTECVYMIAGIAAMERRKVITVDIAGAYLKGSFKEGTEPIYMRLDATTAETLCSINPEYESFKLSDGTMYVQLLKPLYGLIEAAQLWYINITTTLKNIGFVQNSYDKCVWNRIYDGDQQTVCIHVDDLKITCRNEEANQDVVRELRRVYKDVTVNEGKVHSYIGITFDYSVPGKVKLTQEGYISDIMLFYNVDSAVKTPAADNLFDVDPDSPLLDKVRKEDFHTLSAKLLYLSQRTRHDIQVAVCFLVSRVQEPTEQDVKKAVRVLRYLYGTQHLGVMIEPDSNFFCVRSYIDASYGVHPDGKSHTGMTISMGKGPIMSKSTKQKLVSKSSTEAELIALSDSTSIVIWVRNFLEAQGYKMPPAEVYQDNTSTMAMVAAGMPTSNRTRHISIRFFFVKDRVASGELDISYMPTLDMVSDILTKPLQGELFVKLRKELLNYE